MTTKILPILLFFSVALLLNGCGKSDSGSAIVTEPGVVEISAEQFVEASEGGTLTYKVPDGTLVTLEIPPKALKESMKITLKVEAAAASEKAGIDSIYIISIQPDSVKFFNPAYLNVSSAPASENKKNTGLFSVRGDGVLLPLKQVVEVDGVKGNIYTSGVYELSTFDTGKCIEILSEIETSDIPDNWQDLVTVFNGLIWTGTYFNNSGETDDATACMDAATDICGQGIEKYIAKSFSIDEKTLSVYKNDLEKYKYIQKLCADQLVLSKNLDDK